MAKYGEKDGLKAYKLEPSPWATVAIGVALCKIEFWAHQYDFSFQFWGVGNNNVFIYRSNVELHSSGDFETIGEMFRYVIKWCEKANPRVKYPEAIVGKEIDLPD